ncbi:unnamed protein product [Ambrosiozyma monospora]|uniref:Unnamed protein product n=1 Tax=Ambrosiozyma monospora TaxID=43982 RepID=A0A9W6T1U4_AMBMO|nr:unnamed protein product [Ambrosiozyma monospora]
MFRSSREAEKVSPTFTGYIATSKDALIIVQNALLGKLPLIKRRPKEKERPNLIKSGNIFVFVEETSGIKRWTDGMSWSPSRILGRFLIYRELDRDAVIEKRENLYNSQMEHSTSTGSSVGSKSIVSKGSNGSTQPATAVDLAGGEDILPSSVVTKKRKTKGFGEENGYVATSSAPVPVTGSSGASVPYSDPLLLINLQMIDHLLLAPMFTKNWA